MTPDEKSGLGLRGYPLRLDVEGGYVFEREACGCWHEVRPSDWPKVMGMYAYLFPSAKSVNEEWWFCEEHR